MTYNPFTTDNLINEAEFPLTKGGPGSGRTKTLFHIKDWANNTLFGGKTFPSFEDGWSHIYENDPMPDEDDPEYSEHHYDDYYVLPVNGVWPDEEVSKGGPGSGRRPSAYTTGDIQMSASMQPTAIQYAQDTDELKEAADESARLADICKGNENELFQRSLVTNGQAGRDLNSASALFGQAAELHSLASQLANSAVQKFEGGDEEGALNDHGDAISNAEEANATTDRAIASLVKADPSEMPEQWEGNVPSEYAKSKVRKGGPGSGRKPEGATLDASSFSLPKGMKLKINEDVNPDRQWAEFQPAGATMATITAPSGRKYLVSSEHELYQPLPNGSAAQDGEELIAAGFDTDEKLSALQDEQMPDYWPYYALTDSDHEYLGDDNGMSLLESSGKLSDAINDAIKIVADEEGLDLAELETASPSISSQMGQAAPAFNGDKMTIPTPVNARELLDGVCSNMSYWGSWFGEIKISNGKDTGTVGYESQENVLGEDGKPSPTDDWSKVTFTAKCDDPEKGDDGDHSAVKTANMSDIARAYSAYNDKYAGRLGALDDTDAIGNDAFWQLVFYGDVVYG